MALPIQPYVWPRLRHVIGLWVARVTALDAAAILWSEQNQPNPPLPYIGLTRRDFPMDGEDEATITEVVTAATLTCTATVVGSTIAIILFGTRYAYTLVGGDTTETARDALLALITADLIRTVTSADGIPYGVGFQPCTAVASGVDAIDFAGLGYGPVKLAVIEGCTLSSETRAYRQINRGIRRALVRIELFWPERPAVPFETAEAYAGALVDALQEEDTAQWLASRGVGVEQAARLRTQDFSAVAGGALRETRLAMDVLFNATAKRYRPDSPIDDTEAAVVGVVVPTEV